FVGDWKVRMEVGYGLGAVLTDAASSLILREALAPRFRAPRYAAGLEAAVNAVYERTASPQPLSGKAESRRALSTREIYLLFFLACVGITFVSLAWNVSHMRGYTAGRRGWSSSGPGGWYGGGYGGGGWGGGGGGRGGGRGGAPRGGRRARAGRRRVGERGGRPPRGGGAVPERARFRRDRGRDQGGGVAPVGGDPGTSGAPGAPAVVPSPPRRARPGAARVQAPGHAPDGGATRRPDLCCGR